jgi:hypothetical protein
MYNYSTIVLHQSTYACYDSYVYSIIIIICILEYMHDAWQMIDGIACMQCHACLMHICMQQDDAAVYMQCSNESHYETLKQAYRGAGKRALEA